MIDATKPRECDPARRFELDRLQLMGAGHVRLEDFFEARKGVSVE